MAGHHNVVIGVAVVFSAAYLVLQAVAVKRLTGARSETAAKYPAGGILVVAFCLIDWFFGLTGWLLLDAVILIAGLMIAVVHLAILLVQESRQS